MMSKFLATLLSISIAAPASAGPSGRVANVQIGNTGSGVGAAPLAGTEAAPLAQPSWTPTAWIGSALNGDAPDLVAVNTLAQGLRERLPQVSEIAQQLQDPGRAVQAADRLSENIAQSLQSSDPAGPVALADVALLSALSSADPAAALKRLASHLEKDDRTGARRDAARSLEDLASIGNNVLRRAAARLSRFRQDLAQAVASGNVAQFLAEKMDQSGTSPGAAASVESAAVDTSRAVAPASARDRGLQASVQGREAVSSERTAVPSPRRLASADAGRERADRPAPGSGVEIVANWVGGENPYSPSAAISSLRDLAPGLDVAALDGVTGREPLDVRPAPDAQDRPVVARPTARRSSLLDGPLATPELQPDFVNVGMGPTGMMAMIAAIASGRTAAGVEIRGKPSRGVHQNIREEWFHELGLIDKMMIERYGIDGVPKMPNGKPFLLADFFYNSKRRGGNLDFDEIWGKFDENGDPIQNLAGRLQEIVYFDAREQTLASNGGKEVAHVLPPPAIPERADPAKITGNIRKVLDGPSVFQVALVNYELMLRKYLQLMEEQDRAAGRKPRVKVYENHRVVQEDGASAGYVEVGQDRSGNAIRRIIIEEVIDERGGGDGQARRVRKPGTIPIDLGTPVRFALTPGFGGGLDAKTLGYKQHDVVYTDPVTGAPIAARQNWIAVEVTAHTGGRLWRRVSTYTDPMTGEKQDLRQINVGHENTPNVTWVPVQFPDFMTFHPVAAGVLPAGTPEDSPEFVAAAKKLLHDYTVSQIAAVTHRPESEVRRMRMFYGPNIFTLQEKLGETARVAANGNVAGDLMGNGHFLTSGGAMTGMIGHTLCFLRYWDNLARGVPQDVAARILEEGIKAGTEAWLHVSEKEFSGLAPANFGAARAAAIGIGGNTRATVARETGVALRDVLGSARWEQSFLRLMRGEFGVAGRDFFVPERELELTDIPNLVIREVRIN